MGSMGYMVETPYVAEDQLGRSPVLKLEAISAIIPAS